MIHFFQIIILKWPAAEKIANIIPDKMSNSDDYSVVWRNHLMGTTDTKERGYTQQHSSSIGTPARKAVSNIRNQPSSIMAHYKKSHEASGLRMTSYWKKRKEGKCRLATVNIPARAPNVRYQAAS